MKKDSRRRSFFTFKLFHSRKLQEQVAATLAGAVFTGKALEISANTGAATDVLACTSVEYDKKVEI